MYTLQKCWSCELAINPNLLHIFICQKADLFICGYYGYWCIHSTKCITLLTIPVLESTSRCVVATNLFSHHYMITFILYLTNKCRFSLWDFFSTGILYYGRGRGLERVLFVCLLKAENCGPALEYVTSKTIFQLATFLLFEWFHNHKNLYWKLI